MTAVADLYTPPEWAPHKAIWTAWPSHPDLWGDALDPARLEVAAMVRALAEPVQGIPGDRVKVLACGLEGELSARTAVGALAEVVPARFGDIWLRDTGPIFGLLNGEPIAHAFQFNGWGEKYRLSHDDEVAEQVARAARAPLQLHPFVLEGGAIECDGEGTLITTRQCLLNPNRNPGWTEAEAEAKLQAALGIERVIWLDDGLLNDHTDGHVDNLARFVAPGVVVCQAPHGQDDPNAAVLDAIGQTLQSAQDARGRALRVIRIPSPGLVLDEDGEPIPASHMNWLVGNATVVMPVYSDSGDDALKALAGLFQHRRLLGLSAKAILSGGGAFHCITQQEPM
jgi:agmatine deiminase